jgi:hypothetical protein
MNAFACLHTVRTLTCAGAPLTRAGFALATVAHGAMSHSVSERFERNTVMSRRIAVLATLFFGRNTRYAHRVHGAVIINMVR